MPVLPLPEGNGDWDYFGPECPDAYENCALIASPSRFISLDAYNDTNESFYDTPDMDISCSRGNLWFRFDGGGPLIGWGETGLSVLIGSPFGTRPDWSSATTFWTDEGSDDLERVWSDSRDSAAIISLIQDTERQEEPLTIGVVGELEGNAVFADFDVTGFTTNFQRLPCVRQ